MTARREPSPGAGSETAAQAVIVAPVAGIEQMDGRGVDRERDRARRARAAVRPCMTTTSCASPTRTSSSVSAPVGSTTMTSAGTAPSPLPPSAEVAGTDAVGDRLAVGAGAAPRSGQRTPPSASTQACRPARRSVPWTTFIAGEPMNWATNRLAGMVVELERRADLLDAAVVHDDDAVGHRHRLDLVVGDVDRRRLQALVQRLDLGAHRHAQLGVEVGQRLVEQEHLRVAHDRAAHRDALALAARELARIALE